MTQITESIEYFAGYRNILRNDEVIQHQIRESVIVARPGRRCGRTAETEEGEAACECEVNETLDTDTTHLANFRCRQETLLCRG